MSERPRSHPLAWLPPFLVGGAAAVGAETAIGLLLYSGEGFLRALTLIVATLLAALALGLWSAPEPGTTGLVEALRRRWLVVLVAFTLAAVGAAAWSLLGGLSEGALEGALGLALLGALPMYAAGALLGTMGALRASLGMRGPGAAAAAGAALGAVGTGFVLVRTVAPFAMHVFVLVALSGGALVHGHVLDRLVAGTEPPDGPAEGPAEGDEVAEGDADGSRAVAEDSTDRPGAVVESPTDRPGAVAEDPADRPGEGGGPAGVPPA